MKKHNIIFTTLLLTLTAMPFSVSAITVSGTVFDDLNEPAYSATIVAVDTKGQQLKDSKGNLYYKVADAEGKFKLEVPTGAKLKISYVGLADKIVEPGENLNITLEEDKNQVKEVVSLSTKEGDACEADRIKDDYANKEAKGKIKIIDGNKHICVPNECIQDYRVEGTACVKYQCSQSELKAANATNGTWDKNLKACIPVCDEANGFTRNTKNICERTKCAKFEIDNLKKQDKNIDTVELDASGRCVPKTCKKKYHLENGKCVKNQCEKGEEDWDGTKCVKVRCSEADLEALKAKEGKWENNKCIPTKCLDDKNFKLENGSCGANDCPTKELEKLRASAGYMQDDKCIPTACITDYKLENGACTNADILAEKQKAYDDAKAKEQSTENKLLGGLTTAATGIGGMELMQGMAEQSADKDAAADMAAYIETMRCTYGDGKQVKAGPEEIELPGANDQELMNLRGQYLALAQDLKERKEALGMKPGIESEEIIDRTATGLYDDENVGITSGNYASLYRAQALKSETDQAKIEAEQKTSANRVKGGATAAGLGVVAGLAGNSLINGKLGELLKSKKADKNDTNKEEVALLEQETKALEDLKKCLKDAGIKDSSDWGFKNFYPSVLSVKNINCKTLKLKEKNVNASEIFADSNDENVIFNTMNKYFDMATISKMVGFTKEESVDNIKAKIKSSMSEKQKNIDEAQKKDAESGASSDGLGNLLGNVDIKGVVKQAVTGKIVKAETNQ